MKKPRSIDAFDIKKKTKKQKVDFMMGINFRQERRERERERGTEGM